MQQRWQYSIDEVNRRTRKYRLSEGGAAVSYADVLRLWSGDAEFRAHYTQLLAANPFTAFRWETPGVTAASVSRPFEFVVLDCSGLERSVDAEAFADQFASGGDDGVLAFENLGRDATLIVPCPRANPAVYGHLASFLRGAPPPQIDVLWRVVGEQMQIHLGQQPRWLSTAGMGVSWLHVRIDSRPKYYGHAEYAELP